MTEQKTIIPETTGQKIARRLKREVKQRKVILAASLLIIILIAGYSVGYNSGYHQALIDFQIIAGRVITI